MKIKIALQTLGVLWLALSSVHANHSYCRQRNHYPMVDATTACGYLQSWVKDKTVLVVDYQPSGWKKFYLRAEGWVTKAYPLKGAITYNFVKMAEQLANQFYSRWFYCEGTMLFGCLENPFTQTDRPQSDYEIIVPSPTGTQYDCRRDYLRDKDWNTWSGNTRWHNSYNYNANDCPSCCGCTDSFWTFYKECYCKFNDNACEFKEYKTGGTWFDPGSRANIGTDEDANIKLKDETLYDGAYLEIKQNNGVNQIINITVFSNMGHGISFRVQVVVCKDETLVCTLPCNTRLNYYGTISATPVTWYASDTQGSFTLNPMDISQAPYNGRYDYGWLDTDPTPPDGRIKCGYIEGTAFIGLFQDCNGNTAFTHPNIKLDPTGKNIIGHQPIVIDRSTPFLKQTYYYVYQTRGGKKACQKYEAEVCGSENVVSTYTGPNDFGIYPLSFVAGTKVTPLAADVDTFFSVTDSTYCTTFTYDVVMKDSSNNYVASSHFSLGGANGRTLQVDVTTPTNPFQQEHYVRARTQSGQFAVQAFKFRICGAESISNTAGTVAPYFYYYNHSLGLFSVRNVANDFINSNPSCPVDEYYIQIENPVGVFNNFSDHGGTISGSSQQVYVGKPDNLLYIRSLVPYAPYDYTSLWVTAATKARKSDKYKIQVKICGAENFVNLNGQSIFVYGKDTGFQYIDLTLYRTTDDSQCPIDLRQVGTNAPPWTQWTNDPWKMQQIGNVLQVNTSAPQLENLQFRFTTVSHHSTLTKETFQNIIVKICGLENVALTLPAVPEIEYFYYYNTGDYQPQTGVKTVDTWFSNNDVSVQVPPPASNQDCPFIKYELFSPWDWYAYTGSEVAVGFSPPHLKSSTLTIKTGIGNVNQHFWLKASTQSGLWVKQKFHVWICGKERLNITKKLELFVLDYKPGEIKPDVVVDIPPLIDTTDSKCPVIDYTLHWKDELANMYKPYNRSRVRADISVLKMYLNTGEPGREYVYLKALTKGQIYDYLQIEIEVCGTEAISLVPNRDRQIYIEYLQFSGQLNIQTVRKVRYQDLLQVNSTRCVINWKVSELVYWDIWTRKYLPYEGETIKFDPITEQLYVNTTNTTYLDVYLALRTNTSKDWYYLPVSVKIVQYPTVKFNKAPLFRQPNDFTLNFTLNSFQQPYEIKFNVSEQFDDHNALAWLNFSNKDLGFLKLKFDKTSQVPKEHDRRKEFMFYDPKTYILTIRIEGGPDQVMRLANVIYRIRAELSDELGLTADKVLKLNITVNQTWYQGWQNRNYKPPETIEVKREPMGWIDHISVFGEVDIIFNQSSDWKPKKIEDLSQIDDQTLSVYLTPANDWHIFTDQRITSLNFTWEVRQFTNERMRIKLNFTEPLAISPDLRYDELTIYVGDMLKLFDHYSSRRALAVKRHDAIFTKPVQRQMIDNEKGRRLVKQIYETRYLVAEFFLIFLVLAFIFRSPFDRLLKMMVELQIMVNLALMHINIPGNAMLALAIFKPLSEFNFQKEINNRFLGFKELKIESEKQMAYFGQRYTFGYSTYSIVFNMGSMGSVILFLCLFIAVLYLIFRFLKFVGLGELESKFYKSWLEKLVFNDLLLILMCTFLEFGAAALLAMNDFDSQTNSVTNILMAVCLLLIYLVGIPCLFMWIDRKQKKDNRGRDIGVKFGQSFLGFKPQYLQEKNNNLIFVGVFLLSRVIFLMIVFFIPVGWVQIMFTIFLQLVLIMVMTHNRPMHGRWNNYLYLFNLCSIMGCLYHMLCFTDFASPEGEYEMGFSFLGLILTFIIVNLIFALLDLIRILLLIGENLCGLLNKYLRPFWMYLQLKWQEFKDWLKRQLPKLNCYEKIKLQILRYIEYVRSLWKFERDKPDPEIVEHAEAIIERPPTPPPPPPPPPPPKPRKYEGARFEMRDGVWTKIPGPTWGDLASILNLAKTIEKKPEEKPKTPPAEEVKSEQSYGSEEDKPEPKPVFNFKPFQKPLKLESIPEVSKEEVVQDTPPNKQLTSAKPKRRWSIFEMNTLNKIDEVQEAQAYYDPSLYYNDQGKEKTATHIEFIDDKTQKKVSKIVEVNPNRVKGQKLFGTMVGKIKDQGKFDDD